MENNDPYFRNEFIPTNIDTTETKFDPKTLIGKVSSNIFNENKIEDFSELNEEITKKSVRRDTVVINIDSRDRRKINKNDVLKFTILPSNPIFTEDENNIITITHPNHGLELKNRISLTNINLPRTQLTNSLTVTKNSPVIIINHQEHNFQTGDEIEISSVKPVKGKSENVKVIIDEENNFFSITFDTLNPTEYPDPLEYNITNNNINTNPAHHLNNDDVVKLTVNGVITFHNVIVNDSNTMTFIFNERVPLFEELKLDEVDETNFTSETSICWEAIKLICFELNNINKRHIITVLNNNQYSITVNQKINKISDEKVFKIGDKMIVTIRTLNGVPVKFYIADFPVNKERAQGFFDIKKVIDKNHYQIALKVNATETGFIGGDIVRVGKIRCILSGFINPNDYEIELGKTYTNITKMKMVSSEFPNSINVFTNNNNKLYWQYVNEGDIVYSISLPPGNYDIDTLKETLETLFSETSFVTIPSLNQNIKVEIDEKTNDVKFFSTKTNNLSKNPFSIGKKDINDPVNENDLIELLDNVVFVNHPNHGLQSGDSIIVENSDSFGNINSSFINGLQHIVVLDQNTYSFEIEVNAKVVVEPYNEITDTGGGGGTDVNILTFIPIRFLFNLPDTMGVALGFTDSGNTEYCIPEFKNCVINKEYNAINRQPNSAINLSGENYFFITSQILKNMEDTGGVNNVFAKILLTDVPGNYIFNSFVKDDLIFENPIARLSKIRFQCKTHDGNLVDFNNIDHSFCLELTEQTESIPNILLSSRTGSFVTEKKTTINTGL